jgi:hypothetical protein
MAILIDHRFSQVKTREEKKKKNFKLDYNLYVCQIKNE